MKHTFVIGTDGSGINEAIRGLEQYEEWLQRKSDELASRLATMGATYASLGFARAIYNGPRGADVTVEPRGEGAYAVIASGEEVLFVEFGAGVTYGYGHPEAQGFGPGTYPSDKGHWDDPNGWWIPKNSGGGHTYGNPPNMPMYTSVKMLEQEIARVVEEVFVD